MKHRFDNSCLTEFICLILTAVCFLRAHLIAKDSRFRAAYRSHTAPYPPPPARPPASLQEAIRRALSDALGKEVVPHFHEDAALLGGILVRVGDRVMDGSVRDKLLQLRKQMLGA